MAANKSQHFVPAFYLRRFNDGQDFINLYNWKAEKGIFNAKLKKQCQRDYYYGRDLKMEHDFGDLEGMVSSYFKLIDQFGAIPVPGSENHDGLLFWIVLQDCRTPYAADMLNEMTEQMVKATLADHSQVTQGMLDAVRISHTSSVQAIIHYKLPSYVLLKDLQMKLLVAPPDTEFITSDTPVVSHNQLMEFRNHLGATAGIAWKGLQMFYPISPRLLIMLYDPEVYVVGDRKSSWLFLTDKRDVDELNVLQAANSYENFYFNSGRSNFVQVAARARPLRRNAKSKAHIGRKEESAKGFSRLIAVSIQEVRTEMKLSFVRMTKPAKAYQAKERERRTMIPAVVVRSAEVAQRHQEHKAKMREHRAAVLALKPAEGI